MLKATPAGLAEQAAGGGGLPKGNSAKKAAMPKRQQCQKAKSRKTARTARPAGARRRKGKEVGKKESRGIGGGTRVRVAQRGREVSDQNCSQLGLDSEASKAHFRVKPRASSSKHIISTIQAFPSRHCAL